MIPYFRKVLLKTEYKSRHGPVALCREKPFGEWFFERKVEQSDSARHRPGQTKFTTEYKSRHGPVAQR